MCKYHWHFNEKKMFTCFFFGKWIENSPQKGQPSFWGVLDCYVHYVAVMGSRDTAGGLCPPFSSPLFTFSCKEEERMTIRKKREGIL